MQFYVRPRGGVKTYDEGRAARLRAMLEASVQRRHPKGLKVHVHSVDRFGCLASLTRVLKAANLTVTRAKVRSCSCTCVAIALPCSTVVHVGGARTSGRSAEKVAASICQIFSICTPPLQKLAW